MIKHDVYKLGAAVYRIPTNGNVMRYYDSVYRRWMPSVINTPWEVRSKGKLIARNVVFKASLCSQ